MGGASGGSAVRGRRAGPVAWLLLAPLVAWALIFVVVPVCLLAFYSFCRRDRLGRVLFEFTWDNYARVFDPTYLEIFARSVLFAGATTAICALAGYPVAYFIGRAGPRWRSLLLLLVMVPFWTSFLIRTYAWMIILREEGLLNAALQYARVIAEPIGLLYTPAAVVIGLVYSYLPFMIAPIYGSVEKLDNAVVEAALDLGAGPVRAFSAVILPLTRPGIVGGTLLVFIPAIGMFAVTDLMGGSRVPLLGNVIQNQFLQARNWPFGAALATVLTLSFVVVFWVCARRADRLAE